MQYEVGLRNSLCLGSNGVVLKPNTEQGNKMLTTESYLGSILWLWQVALDRPAKFLIHFAYLNIMPTPLLCFHLRGGLGLPLHDVHLIQDPTTKVDAVARCSAVLTDAQ